MNLENILVSVVVPVYNVKDYLPKCIESIQNQTHKNLEIIIVDDGSTDGGSLICDEYAEKDERIIVIHKPNGGITSARKVGVARASGSYIGFVDSDDWIEPEMYEEMLQKAVESEAQIVLTDMYRHKFTGELTVWSGADLSEGTYDMEKEGEMIAQHLLSGQSAEKRGINGGVHIKFFEAGILKRYVEQLEDSLRGCSEDRIIVYAVILNAKKICVRHKAYYHGVDRQSSITHSQNERFLEQLQFYYTHLKTIFSQSPYKDILLKQLYSDIVRQVNNEVYQISGSMLIPNFCFPDIASIRNKKVVLYGAGKVGHSYYKQLVANEICEIVLWVDKALAGKKNIVEPEKIMDIKYDAIIIAIADKMLAEKVSQDLMNMGVLAEKIIWKQPQPSVEFYDV